MTKVSMNEATRRNITFAPSGAFMAYCECVDETIYLESKKAFANILISYGIPRDGDEVCLYAGEPRL